MPKNVIILTWGTTGSSALCQLLRNCGYWCGDETLKKPDYDTHENARLVALNQQILTSAGYIGRYEQRFDATGIQMVSAHARLAPPLPELSEFADACDRHSPWLWKDPRLTLTFDHWAPLLDLKTTHFIILSRETLQMWIASQLRRHIQHYGNCKRTLTDYEAHLTNKVAQLGARSLTLTFEDLKRKPASVSKQVLEFLELREDDIEELLEQHIPDYGTIHGVFDFGKAAMIYIKNFRYRTSQK